MALLPRLFATVSLQEAEFLLSSYMPMEQEAMVAYLMISPNTYYTHADGKTAFLEVVETVTNSKYVRTKPDSTTANNLLSLPRF